jgi:hypothetical protein
MALEAGGLPSGQHGQLLARASGWLMASSHMVESRRSEPSQNSYKGTHPT